MQEIIYDYQQRRLSLLLCSGFASVLAGLGFLVISRVFWKHFGLHMILWDAINDQGSREMLASQAILQVIVQDKVKLIIGQLVMRGQHAINGINDVL
jgi:hypothetical protein